MASFCRPMNNIMPIAVKVEEATNEGDRPTPIVSWSIMANQKGWDSQHGSAWPSRLY